MKIVNILTKAKVGKANKNNLKKAKRTVKRLCPRCAARNVRSCLDVFQIGDDTAALLCTSRACLYQCEVRRDHKQLHRLQDSCGHEEHSDKTAALKDWSFEGKRAVDGFRCPLSFAGGEPEGACAVLTCAVGMLGVVMGRELAAGPGCHHDGRKSCDRKAGDAADELLRDYAELCRHKEACRPGDFAARVEDEFSRLEADLRHLGVDVSAHRWRVEGGYRAADTTELFKRWLGDRFHFAESRGLPCGVVKPSGSNAAEADPGDPLKAWFTDVPTGEWDFNKSLIDMFREDTAF
ncbi:uncharacterized protein LOC134537509 [Bacillus rossius redtenbacheri]|uniref:uncharacterized protein LOC134537509 n=1 Tax=Bacillus rossius redtenbacheri TaxID=93214 RepID=UPI002FDE6315